MSRLLVAQRALTVPGWAKNVLWRSARAVPSLDLRFADNKSLVDAVTGASLITFARASSGTYVDSAGVLQTAATDVPRFDHNPTTGESLGLLAEEARTNLLLNSGTLSAQSVTVTAVAHTLHFTGTGTITLTGTSTAGPLVGTGTGEANRVSLTFTPTAGSLTLTVSGTVTNAQLEAGAFRTGYIATAGAQATRSADVASIGSSAFASFYNQSEGTVFVEAARATAVTGQYPNIFNITDGTGSNRIQLYGLDYADRYTHEISTAGSAQVGFNQSQVLAANTFNKLALAFKTNDTAFVANTSLVLADNVVTLPTVNQLILTGTASRTIKRITYWPQRLPNSTLQALTQ